MKKQCLALVSFLAQYFGSFNTNKDLNKYIQKYI